jgi:phytoene synthase
VIEAGATAHCQALVRSHDKDRYLASLFAPDDKRPHLWALYAFSYEIARIRDLIREPATGEVRLNWWLEVLDRLYAADTVDHPVVVGLVEAIESGSLPKEALMNLIEARRFDLFNDPMSTMTALEGYLGETSSALMQLASLILTGADARRSAATAGFAGVAYGLTGLMRALPIHRSRGQCFVPVELLVKQGITPDHLLRGAMSESIASVLGELRLMALLRLAEARALQEEMVAAALPAFLSAGLVDGYLEVMETPGFDPLNEIAHVPQWLRQLRLLKLAWRGTF